MTKKRKTKKRKRRLDELEKYERHVTKNLQSPRTTRQLRKHLK